MAQVDYNKEADTLPEVNPAMLQIVLWAVLAFVAISAVSVVFKLGFWLLTTALFLLWIYSLTDIILLSDQSLVKKLLWAAGVTFLPTIGSLAWFALKPAATRLLS